MSAEMCNCSLLQLVESHDLVGLRKAIEGPDVTCFSYPCHLQPGLNKHMGINHKPQKHILDNQSIVERACVLGHFDMLELFIHNGCSPNLPTSHGRLIHTLLTSIKTHRSLIDNGTALRMLRLLISTDCDINVKDYSGKSPLFLASELADPGIMREILDHCLDWQLLCLSRENGHTPLHMACMKGSVECVCLLLERLNVDDININDVRNFTPLLCSVMMLKNNMMFQHTDGSMDDNLLQVQYAHIAIIELLLAAGASPMKSPLSLRSQIPHQYISSPPSPHSVIHTALEIVHQHEVKSKLQFYESFILQENFPKQHLQHFVNVHCSDRKFVSLYAEVVRVLVDSYSIVSPHTEDFHSLKNVFPYIHGFLIEIDDYVQASGVKGGHMPRSLLSLARKRVRLCVAKCNKLFLLEKLPIPGKLKDYVRFFYF